MTTLRSAPLQLPVRGTPFNLQEPPLDGAACPQMGAPDGSSNVQRCGEARNATIMQGGSTDLKIL